LRGARRDARLRRSRMSLSDGCTNLCSLFRREAPPAHMIAIDNDSVAF